jgi:hypothetical protein
MSPRPSVWWALKLEEATLYRVTLDNGDELPVVTLVDLPALVTELGRRIRRVKWIGGPVFDEDDPVCGTSALPANRARGPYVRD